MDKVILVFSNFEDAMQFHKKLFMKGNEQGVIYYKDLDEILDIIEWDESRQLLDDYGWTDLSDIKMDSCGDDRWVIKMPEMEKINKKRR